MAPTTRCLESCVLLLSSLVLSCGCGARPNAPGNDSTTVVEPGDADTTPVDSSAAEPPDVRPMTTASRTTGAAPLVVHFDAVSAERGIELPAGADADSAEYRWTFGDEASGTWETDGKPKNVATGYVAAHVFENPGTYTVRLEVSTPRGERRLYQQSITVSDPASVWTTYYVSSAGSDTADGRSEQSAFATVERALRELGPSTRILLRRGDRWDVAATITLRAPGPWLIGAYGSGPRPILSFASQVGVGIRAQGRRGDADDWRFVDLEMIGPRDQTSGWFVAEGSPLSRALFLRLNAHDWERGLIISGDPGDFSENAVVDCSITDIRGHGTGFIGGTMTAVMGNRLSNPGSTHTLRVWYPHLFVLSHNILLGGGTLHTLKLHAPAWNAESGITGSYIVVSDNTFGPSGPWTVAIGPQNSLVDERVEHVVYERNLHLSGARTEVGLALWARHVTVRNNVFNGDGSARWYTGLTVARRGVEPPPGDIAVLNNTVYKGDAGESLTCVSLTDAVVSATVRNTLCSSPTVSNVTLIHGVSDRVVADHNLQDPSPGFTDPENNDFTLRPGSPAIDAGYDVGVTTDASGRARVDDPSTPNTGVGTVRYYDIGADERQP